METRKIAIANNKTQRRYTIETNAETLGQLKTQMLAQGIDFEGMTFMEGLSKTQLLTDDSLLPTNVMFHGQPTNNLVMLLTNPNKQIASGAISRKEAYEAIKVNNLQEAVKQEFGRNFTQVPTADLEEFLESQASPAPVCPEVLPQEEEKPSLPDVKTAPHAATVEWFYTGIKSMVKDNLLYIDDVIVLANLLTDLAMYLNETRPEVTDSDIDDMMRSLGI